MDTQGELRFESPAQASLGDTVRRIEAVIRRDPGTRGLSPRAPAGRLGPAGLTLLAGRRIIILTGFCVRSAGVGETDGPPGALALASALRTLGKRVVFATDAYSAPLLKAGARRLKQGFKVVELPMEQRRADRILNHLVAAFRPTHIVAIERPGSALDGHRYSMRGEVLDDVAPSADCLFSPTSARRGYATIAVGDGGNELGMGSLRSTLTGIVPQGEKIFCASPAEYVIAAGVSNWGAYALAAVLSLLSGLPLLRKPEEEFGVLNALVAAGAVDGCTREKTPSVDGLAWEIHERVLSEIYALTQTATGRDRGEQSGRET